MNLLQHAVTGAVGVSLLAAEAYVLFYENTVHLTAAEFACGMLMGYLLFLIGKRMDLHGIELAAEKKYADEIERLQNLVNALSQRVDKP